jgi:osmoprotectant transport system substrate-binding protein
MIRRRVASSVALVAIAALSISACGDNSGSSASTTVAANATTAVVNGGQLTFKPLDAGGKLTKDALSKGDIQLALIFTSDADIAVNKWVLLDDDKKLQPSENLVPAVRTAAKTDPIAKALNAVSKPLTTAELTELNRQQSQDKKDSDAIAKAWLTTNKVLPYTGDKVTGTLKVGSTNFGEQEIVAEMYAQVLESAGAKVERKFKLGSREVVEPALEKGDIDVYPEYVGTYTLFLDKNASVPSDPIAAVAALNKLANPKGVTLLDPAPAEDRNGFVVTKATADKYKLSKMSDLKTVPDTLAFGGPPECPQREFCAIGLTKTYGLTIK